MSEPSLRTLGLGVELAGRRIIDGVSVVAHSGETVAIVGPNGAGKTTLLRALAGLIGSSGELLIADQDPRSIPAKDAAASRAYCAQKPASAWDFAVRDLGEIVGDAAGFASWLDRLRLADLAGRRLAELSGGEQKAAHLAMTFAALAEPFGGALLLDEPAAALDLGRQEAVRQAIRSFAQAGAACVIATHDLGFARGCDQVIVLSEGRMVASGRPAAVLTPEIIASVWGAEPSADR
jgi:iron complex transport system ATP-binding protein